MSESIIVAVIVGIVIEVYQNWSERQTFSRYIEVVE